MPDHVPTWFLLFTAPTALALVTLLGYMIGLRMRTGSWPRSRPAASSEETWAVMRELEGISKRLRCNLAEHYSTISRFQDRLVELAQVDSELTEKAETIAQELTSDVAHAYDEIRQQACELARVRESAEHEEATKSAAT